MSSLERKLERKILEAMAKLFPGTFNCTLLANIEMIAKTINVSPDEIKECLLKIYNETMKGEEERKSNVSQESNFFDIPCGV